MCELREAYLTPPHTAIAVSPPFSQHIRAWSWVHNVSYAKSARYVTAPNNAKWIIVRPQTTRQPVARTKQLIKHALTNAAIVLVFLSIRMHWSCANIPLTHVYDIAVTRALWLNVAIPVRAFIFTDNAHRAMMPLNSLPGHTAHRINCVRCAILRSNYMWQCAK